ncbi:kinase-like protein [Hesseltinella vesiculosa]|uniref:Kinase-like protein n=1 Tax=Hesseltinella vesiculosa TaxID=101127 RepID=A0A1X2G6M8_9FUNG|nr:kinase-like protein [Hesseltinella vesiculosa]
MGAVCCTPETVDFGNEVELDHFYLLRVIGKGAFGKVRIVQHRLTQREYALKYINKTRCVEFKTAHNIIAERRLLEKINHPLVVNMRYAFHDEENLFMALDLMLGGDLRYLLDRLTSLSEMVVRFYIADLLCALEYLHRKGIAHRDIKPDNILLDESGHAHLTDFNIATTFNEKHPIRWSRAGSLVYMAPEIIQKEGYTTSVDLWSLGVTGYELLFGKRPFSGYSNQELEEAIVHSPVDFPDLISADGKDVIQGLLHRSPKLRYGCGAGGIKKLKQHPWFHGIDWQALVDKTAVPPYKPSTNESNFDAVHELEELLLEEVPLRSRKRVPRMTTAPDTEEERHRRFMDEKFLPYDFTKPNPSPTISLPPPSTKRDSSDFNSINDTASDTLLLVEPSDLHSSSSTGTLSLSGTSLLRRVGNSAMEQYDQLVYKAQGYAPTPNTDS